MANVCAPRCSEVLFILTCSAGWAQQFSFTHPVRERTNFRTHCIPLSIHGDGTPVVGVGKAWGLVWQPPK